MVFFELRAAGLIASAMAYIFFAVFVGNFKVIYLGNSKLFPRCIILSTCSKPHCKLRVNAQLVGFLGDSAWWMS
jgi:hypothetical protein